MPFLTSGNRRKWLSVCSRYSLTGSTDESFRVLNQSRIFSGIELLFGGSSIAVSLNSLSAARSAESSRLGDCCYRCRSLGCCLARGFQFLQPLHPYNGCRVELGPILVHRVVLELRLGFLKQLLSRGRGNGLSVLYVGHVLAIAPCLKIDAIGIADLFGLLDRANGFLKLGAFLPLGGNDISIVSGDGFGVFIVLNQASAELIRQ